MVSKSVSNISAGSLKLFLGGIGPSEGASRFSKLFIDEKVLHYEKREIWEAADAIVHKDPK